MFQITGVPTINQGIGGMLLKTWDERARDAHPDPAGSAGAVERHRRRACRRLPVPAAARFAGPAGAVRHQHDRTLREPQRGGAGRCWRRRAASGKFFFIDADLKIDKPQATLVVDRDKIATLGLTQGDVGAALGGALGGGYVNYFSISGRSYKVIPQVLQVDRLNPSQVLDYYIRTPGGGTDPGLSTIAHIEDQGGAGNDHPLPAAQFRDDRRRDARRRRVAGRGAANSCAIPWPRCASRLFGRLFRPVAPVHARRPAASP